MPRVSMKLTAKEKKEGRDLRDYMVVPIKGAANRRRMGGAAMLVKKSELKPEKPAPKKAKEKPATLLVCSNDIAAIKDEMGEWDTATLDVVKIFPEKQRDDATLSADESASHSNVDFVVYEVREIYRAKRGF